MQDRARRRDGPPDAPARLPRRRGGRSAFAAGPTGACARLALESAMADLKRYLIEEAVEDYEAGRITPPPGDDRARRAHRRRDRRRAARRVWPRRQGRPRAGHRIRRRVGSSVPPAPVKPQVAADDPELVAGAVQFPGEGATLSGYLARPSKAGTFPIVLVCHENRGLTPYVEDVTRRAAKAGYVALAVDLLAREGGTAKHGYDEVPALLGNAPPERHVQDFLAGLAHARTLPAARGDRVGMTGFCFGGGMTWRLAAALPDLRAAVPYYGMPIDVAQVPAIQAAVLAIYAEQDERINKAIPAIEEAMTGAGQDLPQDHLSRHPARLPQRHPRSLRPRRGQGGVDRDPGLVRAVPRLISGSERERAFDEMRFGARVHRRRARSALRRHTPYRPRDPGHPESLLNARLCARYRRADRALHRRRSVERQLAARQQRWLRHEPGPRAGVQARRVHQEGMTEVHRARRTRRRTSAHVAVSSKPLRSARATSSRRLPPAPADAQSRGASPPGSSSARRRRRRGKRRTASTAPAPSTPRWPAAP